MQLTNHGRDPLYPSHSCPLCGIPLYPDGLSGDHIPPVPPFNAAPAPWPTDRRPWSTEVRALVAEDVEHGNILLTGVGVATVHMCVKVPLEKSLSYRDDTPLERLYLNGLSYHPGPVVIPFHDACWKIFSFSDTYPQETHPAHLDPPEALDIQKYLWTPHPPLYETTTFGPLLPAQYDKGFGPLIGPLRNIDFGGPGGRLLDKLTRMVFYMDTMSTPFIGVECHYVDHETRCFGDTTKAGACEISFLIDGPAGERISHVNLLLSPRSGLIGLQLATNYGRSATFGTIQNRLESSAISLPQIPDGEVITGLIGSRPQGRSLSGFARIGIQSQRLHPSEPTNSLRLPNNSILYKPCPIPPEEEAQLKGNIRKFHSGYIDYTYHTYAPLAAVKRITSSIGSPGGSRPESAICGLKLEYHDNTPAFIVGQWFQEHTTTDEKKLNRFHQRTRKTTVEGLRIETSTSRDFAFTAPGADLQSLEERQVHFWQPHAAEEHGVHDPTTLAWELNADTDDLRATCPSCTLETTRFRPSPEFLARISQSQGPQRRRL
ncbi:hypothetical protein BJX62DRAFT_243400 [Aspergillus germanicus]